MASGKAHDRADLILAGLLMPAAIAFHSSAPFYTAVGAIIHLYLSPDLDLARCNARRRWGWLGFIWIPYQRMIPCHRHWSSHLPPVCTLIRVSPLVVWWIWVERDRVMAALIEWNFIAVIQVFPEWSAWVFVGLVLGDSLHLIMDILWSEAGKLKRGLWG